MLGIQPRAWSGLGRHSPPELGPPGDSGPVIRVPPPHTHPPLASLPLLVQSFRLYLPPGRQAGPSISVAVPPCPDCVSPPPPALLAPGCQRSHQPGCPGEFLPVPGKNNWGREKGPQSPRAPALPPGLGVSGPRQEALRFLASPRRPPDLAPAPRPTAQILFRRRSRWRREEARVERGFQDSQAWGFLSPGSGLRLPPWGPQVAREAGCCCRVLRGGWGRPSGCLVATGSPGLARCGQV